MLEKIKLEGIWNFQLDDQKSGLMLPFLDTITLPNTTSHAQKGKKNEDVRLGSLTDEYVFEGHAWFSKEVEIPEHLAGKPCFLYLERTRVTTVWIDEEEIGTQNSLSTPHCYAITGRLQAGKHTITILVDNTNYPTKGGHLTSGDTQTNWNGITGRIELHFFGDAYLNDIQVYPDSNNRLLTITSKLIGEFHGDVVVVTAKSCNSKYNHVVEEQKFFPSSSVISMQFVLGDDALLWSEWEPNLYKLNISLINQKGETLDSQEILVGLRAFKAEGDKFTINETKTFLRGKHDGLIFPLTGFSPTDVEEWVRILGIAKSYGINHYRFHTCCPPEAAFIAADMLGMYMEPELPFWGTITDETDKNHNQVEQDYLISEGFSILKAFGNHPSFVMMSLGNELWGSKTRLNSILEAYKSYDNRHLYTQGSNNFQFAPDILVQEDFFCGVRFSRERLFRGSYAMCDAPLGHVQTDRPNTMKDYDEQIIPTENHSEEQILGGEGTIQIQFGTEARTVKATTAGNELIPQVPVISHEIGQYATYPNFEEIGKYTGSLQARNFEVFRERLEENGLGHLAKKYFECSGKLAVACYKEELEAALRSKRLAGFQILDLQDFPGQGTALVGILDAFMDSKGLITPKEWRSFCSDAVLLARFEKYNYVSDEQFNAKIELSYYRDIPLDHLKLAWELRGGTEVLVSGEVNVPEIGNSNQIEICDISIHMPTVSDMTKVALVLSIVGTDIQKSYDIWIYPKEISIDRTGIHLFEEFSVEALSLLEKGENVLMIPKPERLANGIEGFYSTDFWCYPMFRSISESMNKPVPVGTMGLLIKSEHPVFKHFPCEEYSTYPWWSLVSNSRSLILDGTPQELRPLVQTIDNFERNHKLAFLFECRVLNGSVLVCTLDAEKVIDIPEGKQFLFSLFRYVKSEHFKPGIEIHVDDLKKIMTMK